VNINRPSLFNPLIGEARSEETDEYYVDRGEVNFLASSTGKVNSKTEDHHP